MVKTYSFRHACRSLLLSRMRCNKMFMILHLKDCAIIRRFFSMCSRQKENGMDYVHQAAISCDYQQTSMRVRQKCRHYLEIPACTTLTVDTFDSSFPITYLADIFSALWNSCRVLSSYIFCFLSCEFLARRKTTKYQSRLELHHAQKIFRVTTL